MSLKDSRPLKSPQLGPIRRQNGRSLLPLLCYYFEVIPTLTDASSASRVTGYKSMQPIAAMAALFALQCFHVLFLALLKLYRSFGRCVPFAIRMGNQNRDPLRQGSSGEKRSRFCCIDIVYTRPEVMRGCFYNVSIGVTAL
jgi:hypothetical protein